MGWSGFKFLNRRKNLVIIFCFMHRIIMLLGQIKYLNFLCCSHWLGFLKQMQINAEKGTTSLIKFKLAVISFTWCCKSNEIILKETSFQVKFTVVSIAKSWYSIRQCCKSIQLCQCTTPLTAWHLFLYFPELIIIFLGISKWTEFSSPTATWNKDI